MTAFALALAVSRRDRIWLPEGYGERAAMIARLIAITILALGLATTARAGPLEDGAAAYTRGEYATALQLLRPLAEGGDARAQTMVGTMHAVGRGVGKDLGQAFVWYRRAAEQGHVEAQYYLAAMYEFGNGVAKDTVRAIVYYHKAADGGDAEAQMTLGELYERGRAVRKDLAEAIKWYRKAADQGHAAARLSLGHLYQLGEGVKLDAVRAHMWFSLAAAPSTYVSRYPELEKATREAAAAFRDVLARDMTAAQIAEAERLAGEWKPR